jgi:hypothetical protein
MTFVWNTTRVLELVRVKMSRDSPSKQHLLLSTIFFFYLVCEAIGTAATPGLLCLPRVIVKMIVEKQK